MRTDTHRTRRRGLRNISALSDSGMKLSPNNSALLTFTRIIKNTRKPSEAEPLTKIDAAHTFIGNNLVGRAFHQDMPFMQYVGTIDNI